MNQPNHLLTDQLGVQGTNYSIPLIYDMRIDQDRLITQDDVDRLQRTARAFGEMAKLIKFHVAEVRNGLIKPGQAIDDIEQSLKSAENIAQNLNLDMMLDEVQGKRVLLVER